MQQEGMTPSQIDRAERKAARKHKKIERELEREMKERSEYNQLDRSDIIKRLNPEAYEFDLSNEDISEALRYEKWNMNNYPYPPTISEKRDTLNRILNRALFLQGINKMADSLEINRKYIHINPKDIDKKGIFKKIINQASGLQRKKERLTSKILISIGICFSITGLFFLSSNLTGNVIGSFGKINILGVILFITGLVISPRKGKDIYGYFRNNKRLQ